MAITAVREQFDHTYDFESSDGPLPNQSLERNFWVYSDSKDENPDTIRTAATLPQWGDAHPSIGAAIASRISCRRDPDYPWRWTVRVSYKNLVPKGGGSGGSDDDPTLVTKVRVSTREGQRLVEYDYDVVLIVNTAGEPMTEIVVPWNELQLDFEQYRSTLDAAAYTQLSEYRNAVNSDTWRGFSARQCKIAAITAEEVDIQGTTYLKRNITVHVKDGTNPHDKDWRVRIVSAGFYERNDLDELVAILDPYTGVPVTRPRPLDATGAAIWSDPPITPEIIGGAADGIQIYPELPFAALNI